MKNGPRRRKRASGTLAWLAAIVAAAAICGVAGAAGAPFPDRPITLVIPTAPGGGADIVGRIIAAFGRKYLGQPIEAVNVVGGANDSLGAAQVAASKPDGYTLLLIGNDPITIAPILARVPYSYKSFTPIVQTDTIPIIVVAGPRSPVKSIEELKSYTRAHPNQLTVGITGFAGSPQLAVITVMKALGTNDVHYIPFVSSGPSLIAALGGTVDLTIGSVATAFTMVQAGKVTPLFVTTPDPVAQLPNVPGTKALHVSRALVVWRMIFAPILTPPDIVEELNAGFGKLLADPDLKAKLFDAGVVEAPNTDIPAMQKQISEEVGLLRTLIPTLMTKR